MDERRIGKSRHPAAVILLSVVTLGIYWMVWMYKAPKELADYRGADLHSRGWVGTLAALWGVYIVASIAVAFFVAAELFRTLEPGQAFATPEQAQAAQDAVWPAPVFTGALLVLYAILQLVYLRSVSLFTQRTLADQSVPTPASPVMAILFNVAWALSVAPFVGVVFGLAGTVLAIIWVVQTQNAMNAYWEGPALGMPPITAAAWPQDSMPRPQPAASTQPVAAFRPDPAPAVPAPAGMQEKRFACPQCGTHVTARYTPGVRTPVQCPNCGARGIVR